MVKRELTMDEFEAIKASLAASVARKKETAGAGELGTDQTVKAVEARGTSSDEGLSTEEELLTMLGRGTLYIEMDD